MIILSVRRNRANISVRFSSGDSRKLLFFSCIAGLLYILGNGYIGTSLTASSQLHIKSDRVLSFPINFYPIVDIGVEGVLPAGE